MKTNVTMLALVLGITCMQSAQAQSFKRVTVNGNVPISQVASGGNSVWALGNGKPFIFNGSSFALASNISLTQIAVGGGNAVQADAVWALNSSGDIYRASKSGASWVFSQVPGILDGITVGPGYQEGRCHPYEVWGLNTGSYIYRYDYCKGEFVQQPGTLCDIHTGGGDVWGADCGPNVYRFDFSTGVFDPIASPFQAFPALTVGPNGEVWATDSASTQVFQYDDNFSQFNEIDSGFGPVQAGGDGVWAISPINANHVYRFEASTLSFVQVPGAILSSISVGSGGGVWGIINSQVFAFSRP